jgi:hypothetical protein
VWWSNGGGCGPSPLPEFGLLTDFVLIHSTGQSGAGWQRLTRALEQRGHRAHAVELPGDEPDLGTADYAEIVVQQLENPEQPVVVAHSGSGVLLPATARALEARRQVWLAAWVPDPNASFVEEVTRHAETAFDPDWIGKDPTTDAAVAAHFLYHDCDPSTLQWALSTRRLFVPIAALNERSDLPQPLRAARAGESRLRRAATLALGVSTLDGMSEVDASRFAALEQVKPGLALAALLVLLHLFDFVAS